MSVRFRADLCIGDLEKLKICTRELKRLEVPMREGVALCLSRLQWWFKFQVMTNLVVY